jgi:surfactin synthase thioesterase subunit
VEFLNLYCFPYAGGSSWIFRPLARQLAGRINVVPVELPGRGRRRAEACVDQWDELISTLASELSPELDRPHAFLGYSFGALVALNVAHKIAGRGSMPPRALIACALGGPTAITHEKLLHQMDDRAMFEALRDLGGIPAELLDSPELIALSAPAMRADLTLFETFKPLGRPLAGIPIHAYCGKDDASVGDRYAAWQNETDAAIRHRSFDGGHMFLHDMVAVLADSLETDLVSDERASDNHLAMEHS